MDNSLLNIHNCSMVFGGLCAVDRVHIRIDRSEIVALIGPNGAGKTTLFNCITGVYKPSSGKVIGRGKQGESVLLNGMKPHEITQFGMARTFQNIRLFNSMTALENVMIGRHPQLQAGIFGAIFRDKKTRLEEERVIDESHDILKKFSLEKYTNEAAENLPYGAQRLLEIARAMATEPNLLLLDEPAAGMNPQETRELDEKIAQIRDEDGVSILLIEHDMSLVMSLSERIYVLDYGKLIAEGSPHEVRVNPAVVKAYLGE